MREAAVGNALSPTVDSRVGGWCWCYPPVFEHACGINSKVYDDGQRDARPAVTFPALEHHCPSTNTELYCLVTEAGVCEWLAQGHTQQRNG